MPLNPTRHRIKTCLAVGLACLLTGHALPGATSSNPSATPAPVRIYLDADRTNATTSGDAIEAGMRAAVELHGGEVAGRPIELVMLDHRGNTRRSQRSINRFADDPNAIAIFTGLHSPPVLSLRDQINQRRLLMLDPWAAAGPITRPDKGENWIFRLSVDDANAGEFILNTALDQGIQNPGLMLEDTGWGKANHQVMGRAAQARLGHPVPVKWFAWNVSKQAMRIALNEMIDSGVDAVVFVGNTPEGIKLVELLLEIPEDRRPPLYSHWGIIGGDLSQSLTLEQLNETGLKFIQTRFSLSTDDPHRLVSRAFKAAQDAGFYKDLHSAREVPAPTGFVHGFDLMRIALKAIEQTGLSGQIEADRRAVKAALENLKTPVQGIIKTYDKPFEPYTEIGSDAHEALGPDDYVLAQFGDNWKIINLPGSHAAVPSDHHEHE